MPSNRKPHYNILIPESPTDQEIYAATELRHYLNMITASGFTVVSEDRNGKYFAAGGKAGGTSPAVSQTEVDQALPVIAIGNAASKLGVARDDSLGLDGFTIKTIGQSLAITGGKRGVVYGVYELLETLGCRFFTPLSEKVPCIAGLRLPELDITKKPALEYRLHNYKDITEYHRFAVKSRVNGGEIPDEMGGGIQFAWFVHSFGRNILDADEHFESHPEYFSMKNGKRLKEFTQLCLTNPDVVDIATDKVRAALLERPECGIISVSPNDWYNYCECPACSEIDKYEESNAGTLIHFVNQIAERIEDEFPYAVVETLAYQYSRQVPKHIRPRGNVCVRLCSIESCFSHSFESCDDDTRKTKKPDGSRTNFIQDLRDWAKASNRLYIWDYTTGFANYPAPHANWGVLQPNMRSFVQNNVKGVFEQACGASGGSADLNELRAYLICKLMWDAEADVETLKREFCEYYYGDAAEHILSYIQTLTDKVERENIHTGFNENCDKAYLTDEMLMIYDSIFDKAEESVKGDALRLGRVSKARLSIRWVRMKNRQMLKGIIDPEEMNRFFADWRAHGLTRIDEWVSAETSLRAFLDGKWRGVEYYRHWTEEGPEKK